MTSEDILAEDILAEPQSDVAKPCHFALRHTSNPNLRSEKGWYPVARSSAKKTRKRLHKARKRQTRRERETDSSVPEHGDPTRPDKIRMSEVISHVAKPLFDKFGDTTRDLEFIITLTIFAWNLTLLPPDVREETLEKLLLEKFASDPELAANFRSYYDLVAERKARFYPHLQRMIIDVKFRRESESQVFFEVLHQPVPSHFDGKPN